MDIGKRVRAAREAQDLTQEELARRASVPLNRIGRIETGVVTDPHYSSLSKIAEGLGLSVGELLGESVGTGKASARSESTSPEETSGAGPKTVTGSVRIQGKPSVRASGRVVEVPLDIFEHILGAAEGVIELDPEVLEKAHRLVPA